MPFQGGMLSSGSWDASGRITVVDKVCFTFSTEQSCSFANFSYGKLVAMASARSLKKREMAGGIAGAKLDEGWDSFGVGG